MTYNLEFSNLSKERDSKKKTLLAIALLLDFMTFIFALMAFYSLYYLLGMAMAICFAIVLRFYAKRIIFSYTYALGDDTFEIYKNYANKRIRVFNVKMSDVYKIEECEMPSFKMGNFNKENNASLAHTTNSKAGKADKILFTENISCDFLSYVIKLTSGEQFIIACDDYILAKLNFRNSDYDLS